jgi:hypothetical protein
VRRLDPGEKRDFFAGGGVFPLDSPFNGWLLFFFEAEAGDLLSGKLYVSSPHIRIPHIQLAPPHLSFHY